jgi:integrase
VMRAAGDGPDGVRLRGVIAVLWRAGLRISETLALNETDLDRDRGALLVRHSREISAGRSEWTLGVVTPRAVAAAAHRAAGRTTVLRRPRTDTRPAVRTGGHPRRH